MLEFGNGVEQRSADHIETFLVLKKTESGEGSGIADLAKSPNGSSANTMIWIGEQIEQALDMSAKFMTPGFFFLFGLIGNVVMTVLMGLLISIFTQRPDTRMPE